MRASQMRFDAPVGATDARWDGTLPTSEDSGIGEEQLVSGHRESRRDGPIEAQGKAMRAQ